MTGEQTQQLGTRSNNRSRTPSSAAFTEFIGSQWAQRDAVPAAADVVASFTPTRRATISHQFTGTLVALAAGAPKVRSNDTDYRFRPHSAFAHLTGWGADAVPGAVLLLAPTGNGHGATLYFRAPAGRDSDEFYANPAIGEFWTGRRPSLDEVSERLGLPVSDISELPRAVADCIGTPVAVLDAGDPNVAALFSARDSTRDAELVEATSELRLVKDAYEIDQMREAIRVSIDGFERVVGALPHAIEATRGERVIEGAFFANAREQGNDLGYETIAAAGPHACILHWIRNDGPVLPGDVVLVDAGVELESCYTADITRTIPVSGTFSPEQRRVYEAVLEAADAAFAVARPGNRFRDVHNAAMEVIARRVSEWGLLPISLDETLKPENQLHRRYMVHGTSHHLGIDVHDCAQARREMYLDGEIKPGMIFTIEPGLYFQPDDLTVPAELRGIGVRIEDDVLITTDGNENLTAGIPRRPDELEAWVRERLPHSAA